MDVIDEVSELRPRFDYIKAAVNIDYDQAQQYADEWYNVFDIERGENKAQRHANVQSVRRNKDGSFLYIFEAWGENCNNASRLNFDKWSNYLARVDVRGTADITRAGIDRMYSYLSNHKAGARNVQLFSSKARSKRSGRDTGGYGIAVGSHKSNLRTTFYVRGRERGAYEFQCMGALLAGCVHTSFASRNINDVDTNASLWEALMLNLYVRGQNDFTSLSGLTREQQLKLIDGGPDVAAERQQTLTKIEDLIDGLSHDELVKIHQAIQMRLF